jgi:hypothetical protein
VAAEDIGAPHFGQILADGFIFKSPRLTRIQKQNRPRVSWQIQLFSSEGRNHQPVINRIK